MNINMFSHVIGSLFLLLSPNIFGKELVINKNNFGEVDIAGHLAVVVDTHAVWNWNQLPKEEKLWDRSIKGNILSGGLTSYAYWYKIELENLAEGQYLTLNDPLIDEVDVYFVNDSDLIGHSKSGAALTFEKREVDVPDYFFLLPQGSYNCYIRLIKYDSFQSHLHIASFKYLLENRNKNNLVLGLSFGILLILIFYNLLIYFSIKEKSYLYYIYYLCAMLICTATLKGLSFQYLWENKPQFNLFFPSYQAAALVFVALFVMTLLQTKIYLPKYTKGLYLFIGIGVLTTIVNFFSYKISSGMIQCTILIFTVYLILTGVQSYRKGVEVAKLFLWAWSLYVLFVITYIIERNGIIISNALTHDAIFYGSVIEAILFSRVLAYRIRVLHNEKKEAQQKEAQEREEKYHFLREQAHEINNPVNLVSGSMSILNNNVQDIIHLIALYRQLPDLKKQPVYKEIRAYEDEINIELTTQELSKCLVRIRKAVDRVHEITYNLSLLGKSKETIKLKVDINKSIKNTLTMVETAFNGAVQLHTEFGNIPTIKSYMGKLNQVFTNLTENALEAIREKPELKNEFLFIKTSLNNNKIIIEFKDSGIGMSAKTKKRLFEKFYTTKSPDKGTGLGMTISKRIIENHKGTIEVESERGKGTTITISLPVKH